MQREIMKNLIIGTLLSISIVILSAVFIHHAVKSEVAEYEKPDTLIVIKNGKADTTITIKQAPSIFK